MIQHQFKTLLVGTNKFAADVFLYLNKLEFLDVKGIITQPDKLKGRKHLLEFSETKKAFHESGVPIFQPIKFKEEYQNILDVVKPDIIIVCAYGKILPKGFIEYPKYKSINIHASLLPQLRGATPIHSAILNRLTKTGITIQVMSEGMDEGDIISSSVMEIDENITVEELFKEMIPVTLRLIDDSLLSYLQGHIIPTKQVGEVSYCYVSDFSYDKGLIDWNSDFDDISAKVRSFNPEPGAWIDRLVVYKTKKNDINQKIKIYSVAKTNNTALGNYPIGYGLVQDGELLVKCKNGWVSILTLQKEGGKIISSKDFINGLK